MFQITPPDVIEFLRHNELIENCDGVTENPSDNSKICVISVFGSSSGHPSGSGFKRAFRLAIDCFGNIKLFSERDVKEGVEATLDNDKEEATGAEGEAEEFSKSSIGSEEEEDDKKTDDANGAICSEEEGGDVDDNGVDSKSESLPPDSSAEIEKSRSSDDVESVLEEGGTDTNPLDDNNGQDAQDNAFSTAKESPLTEIDCCFLDGFYCKARRILFIHLTGAYDSTQLIIASEQLHQSISENGFIPVWSSMKSQYCRYLLLLFSLSHIMLLSHPASSFDTSFLHLFRVLDSVRLSIKSAISRALDQTGQLPKDWVYHGRICSPRLLFLFEIESKPSDLVKTAAKLHYNASIEKQYQLEDEIYHILRKCRVITNISANSLCAIPSDDEFVFLFEKNAENAIYMDQPIDEICLEIIHQASISTKNNFKTAIPSAYRTASGTMSMKHAFRSQPTALTYNDVLDKFKDFILLHSRMALTEGFDDDSRRVADYKHFFVLPTFREWKVGFKIVFESLFSSETKSRSLAEGLNQLTRYVNVDPEYLNSQCSSVFPKIYAVYQRGLPEYYSYNAHRIRLTHAMNAYFTISRGPGVVPWLNKLAEKCDAYWKRGRQQCEIVSLFKHSCINPLHRVAAEDSLEILPVPEMDEVLPEIKHSAGGKIYSQCNCGRKQGIRDEPFTIREANYAFYQRMAQECCDRDRMDMDKYEFPIFVPNNTNEVSLEEMLSILKTKSDESSDVKGHSNSGSQIMEIGLRQENILGDDDGSSESQEMQEELFLQETITNDIEREENTTLNIPEIKDCDESVNGKEEEPENKLSKSEYLPGMIHSKSPKGLLPKFPSWSLVRIGTSSLYNHSSGISPRSGFLSGTNFLLPWDVMVKAEAGVSKPIPRIIRGRKPTSKSKPISNEFNVKVFFGLEYECQRGHRQMANDYEKIVNFTGGNSGLREAGTKIATSDMPLYFKCPCKESRDGRIMIAQIMRVHIVTPKAPVHCIISPKVQPAPSPCPTFFSGNLDPIKLTPSSYWVLRLPYCYVGDHVYVPPLDPDSIRSGKLLKGMISVKSMTPVETKAWEKDNL